MGVINCPKCKGIVSDRLKKCPHCGHEMTTKERYPQFYEKQEDTHKEENYSPQNTYSYPNSYKQSDLENYKQQEIATIESTYTARCPRCGSTNISYQREQTASFGATTNKVVIQQAEKSKGCLWWMCVGWWWIPMYWLLIGWWWRPLMGGRTKRGLNFNASKSVNRTMAVCQNCGHSWKVK